MVGEIVDIFSRLLQWDERKQTSLPEHIRERYNKLLQNVDLESIFMRQKNVYPLFGTPICDPLRRR